MAWAAAAASCARRLHGRRRRRRRCRPPQTDPPSACILAARLARARPCAACARSARSPRTRADGEFRSSAAGTRCASSCISAPVGRSSRVADGTGAGALSAGRLVLRNQWRRLDLRHRLPSLWEAPSAVDAALVPPGVSFSTPPSSAVLPEPTGPRIDRGARTFMTTDLPSRALPEVAGHQFCENRAAARARRARRSPRGMVSTATDAGAPAPAACHGPLPAISPRIGTLEAAARSACARATSRSRRSCKPCAVVNKSWNSSVASGSAGRPPSCPSRRHRDVLEHRVRLEFWYRSGWPYSKDEPMPPGERLLRLGCLYVMAAPAMGSAAMRAASRGVMRLLQKRRVSMRATGVRPASPAHCFYFEPGGRFYDHPNAACPVSSVTRRSRKRVNKRVFGRSRKSRFGGQAAIAGVTRTALARRPHRESSASTRRAAALQPRRASRSAGEPPSRRANV